MGQNSKIEWTEHSFNPWSGCQRISEGCRHCYAADLAQRFPDNFGSWGADGVRRIASEAKWREPLRWSRAAEKAGERHRVFCASMADVFEDHPQLVAPRRRLFRLIGETPHLDWLLLTKRPENIRRLTYQAIDPFDDPESDYNAAGEPNGLDVHEFGELFPNIWLGASVENQDTANTRIPHLLAVPATIRFLSVEPLLGPVALTAVRHQLAAESFMVASVLQADDGFGLNAPRHRIDWVILGGESGPHARPCHLNWIRSLVIQCRDAGVPVFVKQLGAVQVDGDPASGDIRVGLGLGPKGGDGFDEWPEDLRIREFPGA